MVRANKFLKVCQKCKTACCKMGGPNFTEKEMKKVLKAGFKNYFFEFRPGIYELKSKKGVCPYLKKDNSCMIHDIKPILCLCWPVFPDYKGKNKRYIVFDCPLTNLLSKKDIEKCRKEASRVSKELIDAALDMSSLPKKDKKRIMKRFKKFKKRELK